MSTPYYIASDAYSTPRGRTVRVRPSWGRTVRIFSGVPVGLDLQITVFIYIVNFRKLRIFGFSDFPKIYNVNAVISDFPLFRNRYFG